MIGPMIGPSSQCWQPILAINIGPMIDRGLDDNCGLILAFCIGPKIAPDDRPRITARICDVIFSDHCHRCTVAEYLRNSS